MIAIHDGNGDRFKGCFTDRWIAYCKANDIPYKLVNCYNNYIIQDVTDCRGIMWHFSHANPIDFQYASNLVCALEASGKRVFPNSAACWHFDDKVSQKYLLESIGAPLIPTYVFWSRLEAMEWLSTAEFPLVAKLRGGAASANVRILHTRREAENYTRRSFGRGYRQFNRIYLAKRAWSQVKDGRESLFGFAQAIGKIGVRSVYEKVRGFESGYVYFQQFLPNNLYDIRIVVIGERAFSIRRMTLDGDFRASGSGRILYDKNFLDEKCVTIAFDVTQRLQANCLAFDFLYGRSGEPLIAEISYGFVQEGYDACTGYWDLTGRWHEGPIYPQGWMVEDLLGDIEKDNQAANSSRAELSAVNYETVKADVLRKI